MENKRSSFYPNGEFIPYQMPQAIGKLYAGDWMFIPADFHDAAADIAITANGGTIQFCYAIFHEGTTLLAT